MGEIKSALELALEKTKDIKEDKRSLVARETREHGMKIASAFLNGPGSQEEFSVSLKKTSTEDLPLVKEGIKTVLLTNISLSETPPDKALMTRIATVFKLLGNNDAEEIINQLTGFIEQYQENRKQLRDNLAERYQPILAQKEQEISRQTGSKITLQPEQDPEFVKALQENYKQLRQRYEAALKQAKEDLATL
ncbi:MAG: hypothetical protein JW874_06595 [Spirochaetales bacterium]|nr:hypothetical protein [Spirochaetales bacterium]